MESHKKNQKIINSCATSINSQSHLQKGFFILSKPLRAEAPPLVEGRGSPYFSATSVFRTPPAGSVHARAARPVLPSRPVLLSRPVLPPRPVLPARLGLAAQPLLPARFRRHARQSIRPSVHPAVHPSYPPLPPETEPELRHSSLFTPLDSSGVSEEAGERLLHC